MYQTRVNGMREFYVTPQMTALEYRPNDPVVLCQTLENGDQVILREIPEGRPLILLSPHGHPDEDVGFSQKAIVLVPSVSTDAVVAAIRKSPEESLTGVEVVQLALPFSARRFNAQDSYTGEVHQASIRSFIENDPFFEPVAHEFMGNQLFLIQFGHLQNQWERSRIVLSPHHPFTL